MLKEAFKKDIVAQMGVDIGPCLLPTKQDKRRRCVDDERAHPASPCPPERSPRTEEQTSMSAPRFTQRALAREGFASWVRMRDLRAALPRIPKSAGGLYVVLRCGGSRPDFLPKNPAGRFRGEARFSTWFYRILVNLALDHRRRRRWWERAVAPDRGEEETALVERQPAPGPDPGERASEGQAMTRLWDAVRRLSPQQRAAVVLSVQEQLSTAEVAAVLEISEPTVRVHLLRAVQALRKVLKP